MAFGLMRQRYLKPGVRDRCPVLLFIGLVFWVAPAAAQLMDDAKTWDQDSAINHSQAVIGKRIGDYQFTRRDGTLVSLSEYTGKPLLISMVFTSCHHVCPMTTRRLEEAVRAAREVMDPGAFNVLTIGFDWVNDTPVAMQSFARAQKVHDENWDFLSADFETINALATDLGFIFYRSPRGFDHITQVSVTDQQGEVYRQVYGAQFELPWLVEPLKQLVFNRPEHDASLLAGLLGKIRLFCTVYDPASDRYHFDYSLFIQMAIDLMAIIALSLFLIKGLRRPGSG
jgi:protein SCO1/2